MTSHFICLDDNANHVMLVRRLHLIWSCQSIGHLPLGLIQSIHVTKGQCPFENRQQKDMCIEEIGVRVQNTLHNHSKLDKQQYRGTYVTF